MMAMAPLPQVRGWAILIGVNSKSRPFATGSYALTATGRAELVVAQTDARREFGSGGMKGASQKRYLFSVRAPTIAQRFNAGKMAP